MWHSHSRCWRLAPAHGAAGAQLRRGHGLWPSRKRPAPEDTQPSHPRAPQSRLRSPDRARGGGRSGGARTRLAATRWPGKRSVIGQLRRLPPGPVCYEEGGQGSALVSLQRAGCGAQLPGTGFTAASPRPQPHHAVSLPAPLGSLTSGPLPSPPLQRQPRHLWGLPAAAGCVPGQGLGQSRSPCLPGLPASPPVAAWRVAGCPLRTSDGDTGRSVFAQPRPPGHSPASAQRPAEGLYLIRQEPQVPQEKCPQAQQAVALPSCDPSRNTGLKMNRGRSAGPGS